MNNPIQLPGCKIALYLSDDVPELLGELVERTQCQPGLFHSIFRVEETGNLGVCSNDLPPAGHEGKVRILLTACGDCSSKVHEFLTILDGELGESYSDDELAAFLSGMRAEEREEWNERLAGIKEELAERDDLSEAGKQRILEAAHDHSLVPIAREHQAARSAFRIEYWAEVVRNNLALLRA